MAWRFSEQTGLLFRQASQRRESSTLTPKLGRSASAKLIFMKQSGLPVHMFPANNTSTRNPHVDVHYAAQFSCFCAAMLFAPCVTLFNLQC